MDNNLVLKKTKNGDTYDKDYFLWNDGGLGWPEFEHDGLRNDGVGYGLFHWLGRDDDFGGNRVGVAPGAHGRGGGDGRSTRFRGEAEQYADAAGE
jgi:hypothetical protein